MRAGDQPLGAAGKIAHTLERQRRDAVGIEHDDVGGGTRPQAAAVADAEEIRGLAGEHAHGTLERQHPLVAHPMTEKVRRVASVAELPRVRSRVGKTEQRIVAREQPADGFFVRVQHRRAESRGEVFFEREIEDQVDEIDAALASDLAERAVE